jgi:selenide,water dikinase
MAVTGIIHPGKIFRNSGARPGDILILTKPIGTGIMATAMKRGLSDQQSNNRTIELMLDLNKAVAEIMQEFPVSTATDVTGFGLLGHLHEVTKASGLDAEIDASAVPILPGAEEMAAAGIIPGGTLSNLEYAGNFVSWDEKISYIKKVLLCDAQTSGGLLIAIPERFVDDFLTRISEEGKRGLGDREKRGFVIGKILLNGKGLISVR